MRLTDTTLVAAAREPRDRPLFVRMAETDRALVDQAARSLGLLPTSFARMTVLAAAREQLRRAALPPLASDAPVQA